MQQGSEVGQDVSHEASVNCAALLHGPNDLRFGPAPKLAALEPGKVRLEVKTVGICGTDVHLFKKVLVSSLSR